MSRANYRVSNVYERDRDGDRSPVRSQHDTRPAEDTQPRRRGSVTVSPAFHHLRLSADERGELPSEDEDSASDRGYKPKPRPYDEVYGKSAGSRRVSSQRRGSEDAYARYAEGPSSHGFRPSAQKRDSIPMRDASVSDEEEYRTRRVPTTAHTSHSRRYSLTVQSAKAGTRRATLISAPTPRSDGASTDRHEDSMNDLIDRVNRHFQHASPHAQDSGRKESGRSGEHRLTGRTASGSARLQAASSSNYGSNNKLASPQAAALPGSRQHKARSDSRTTEDTSTIDDSTYFPSPKHHRSKVLEMSPTRKAAQAKYESRYRISGSEISDDRRKRADDGIEDANRSTMGMMDENERASQPTIKADNVPDIWDVAGEFDARSQTGSNVSKMDSPAKKLAKKMVQLEAVQEGSKSSENSGDGENEIDPTEDFKFVRKTLPRNAISHEEERMEFRCLDYSPLVNVRPVDLLEQMRPVKASRKIRLFISITCYNEDGDELRRTLHGIASNLPMLSKMGLHWSEICVAIFIDGREHMSKSMSDYLQFEMKLYDPTILRSLHKGRPVVLHVFERSVELPKHTSYREYHYPLQCMLGLKERNGGKLNSHLWFFSGFCVQINPKYTVLFDVGTVPQEDALLRMYAAMEDDPQVGGSCGEIAVRNPKPWNILDASQAFEYKISHVLDKAAESVCGYITVLPGAFSMYRWVAIRGEPLCAYFTIEEIPLTELGPAVSNMYLAEDRILCFEILAKKYRQWLLRYVPGAIAHTDAPQTLVELIKQRRRWLNGSFFALVYYLYHFPRFMSTSHGFFRKLLLCCQFCFLGTTAFVAWFNVALLYLSFIMVINTTISFAPFGVSELQMCFSFFYLMLIFLQIVSGLAGKVNQMHTLYFTTLISYAIIMTFSVVFGIWLVTNQTLTAYVGLAFALALFSYLFAACFHGALFKSAIMFPQYLMMIPTFVNVFPIYSFCNMHDISWGTKEGNLQSETRRMHAGKADRAMQKAMLAQEAIQRLKAEVHDQKRQVAIAKRAAAIAAALPPKKASVQTLVTPLNLNAITGEPAEGAASALSQRQQSERQLSRGESASSLGGKSNRSANARSSKSLVGEAQPPVIARLLEGEAEKFHSGPMSPEEAAIVLAAAEATGLGAAEAQPDNGELVIKGGADMVKVIDEDNRMEGFVDMTVLGSADAVLKMNLDEATAFNQAVIGKDALDTKKLIRDARKAAKAHREAAEREKRMADELALNKQAMQSEFNYFRIRMVMGWVIMNALFAVLMLGYDPKLQLYSAWVSSASVYTVGFKLLGSMIFQLMRGVKWLFRRMCGCCYRIEESETKNRNPVCCMRPSHYYALDDMWESEHNYDHAYPEEVGIAVAEAEQAALANGLTYVGDAPDGTALYYAADGTGPYDVNGVAIDPTLVGFQLGPNMELLGPDGSAVVDEFGNAIIYTPPEGVVLSGDRFNRNDSNDTHESDVHTIVARETDDEGTTDDYEDASAATSSTSTGDDDGRGHGNGNGQRNNNWGSSDLIPGLKRNAFSFADEDIARAARANSVALGQHGLNTGRSNMSSVRNTNLYNGRAGNRNRRDSLDLSTDGSDTEMNTGRNSARGSGVASSRYTYTLRSGRNSQEFPMVRVNESTMPRRANTPREEVHINTQTLPSRDIASRAAEDFGYHDPVTGKWVAARGNRDDSSDEDAILVDSDAQLDTMMHTSRMNAQPMLVSGVMVTDHNDSYGMAEEEEEDDDSVVDLLDLDAILADAEQSSKKVLERRTITTKDVVD